MTAESIGEPAQYICHPPESLGRHAPVLCSQCGSTSRATESAACPAKRMVRVTESSYMATYYPGRSRFHTRTAAHGSGEYPSMYITLEVGVYSCSTTLHGGTN